MSDSKLLQRISITSPCSQNWDEMRGNDQVRFCSHCNLNVRDVSLMTRFEAEHLVRRSKGRICLRIHRTPAGEVVTRQAQNLYRISRRASRIAAGTFTALMSMSAAGYAQSSTNDVVMGAVGQEISAPVKSQAGGAWLVGTVVDKNGAVIVGVTVIATNERTGWSKAGTSNDLGEYRLEVNAGDLYEVKIAAPGFADHVVQHLDLDTAHEVRQDVELEVNMVTLGVVSIMPYYAQPLVQAASNQDIQLVKALLSQGQRVDQSEPDRTTALDIAVMNGNVEIARVLLAAGADVCAVGPRGRTILSWVGGADSGEMVALLVNAGAKINAVDDEGDTPLMGATRQNDPDLIGVLLHAGARIDAQNFSGTSALMVAAAQGNEEAAKALLAAGANYRLRNELGEDAFRIARKTGNEGVCQLLLLKAGAEDPGEVQF